MEELKYPQEYENKSVNILDGLNGKEINSDKIPAIFKRGCLNTLSMFIISQDYYELPKRTIRANGNIYHKFKPNNFLDVRNFYQDKASVDMTLCDVKYLISTCWDEKKPLTIDMTKDKFTGR